MVRRRAPPSAYRGGGSGGAKPYTIPAPVGGWDAISALANMPEDRAITLENFYPEPGLVRLRKGYSSHATGMSGAVESLMTWNGPTSSKMFAANGTSIYDVTTAGAVGAAAVSSLTNARFQHVNMLTSGGHFLVLCNGADSVRNYDGTSWTTPSITNVTSADLINVAIWKSRLWFVQKNTLKAWYLPSGAISGAAAAWDLSGIFKRGGYLMAIGAITFDSGDGVDDFIAFVTSEGEVALYQGTDPAAASTFAIVGRYEIGAPIGRRCLVKLAGDLGIITVDGFFPLMQAIRVERAQQQSISLSVRIQNAVVQATQLYKSNFGWQAIGYPRVGYALFNIPRTENSLADQYVMNIQTKAWCKFTGQNANCWELLSDRLYFGANDGKVYKADDGFSDNGADREGNIKTAFNYFGAPGRLKQFKMARALIASDAAVTPALEMDVDFSDVYPTAMPTAAASDGPFWDEEFWDDPFWGSAADMQLKWTSVRGTGVAGAPRLRIASDAADISVSAFGVIAEIGGLVG